jgi:hypothetical protein
LDKVRIFEFANFCAQKEIDYEEIVILSLDTCTVAFAQHRLIIRSNDLNAALFNKMLLLFVYKGYFEIGYNHVVVYFCIIWVESDRGGIDRRRLLLAGVHQAQTGQ